MGGMYDHWKDVQPTSWLLSHFEDDQEKCKYDYLLHYIIDLLVLEHQQEKLAFKMFFEEAKNGITRDIFKNIVEAVCPYLRLTEVTVDGIFDLCKTDSLRHQRRRVKETER